MSLNIESIKLVDCRHRRSPQGSVSLNHEGSGMTVVERLSRSPQGSVSLNLFVDFDYPF